SILTQAPILRELTDVVSACWHGPGGTPAGGARRPCPGDRESTGRWASAPGPAPALADLLEAVGNVDRRCTLRARHERRSLPARPRRRGESSLQPMQRPAALRFILAIGLESGDDVEPATLTGRVVRRRPFA